MKDDGGASPLVGFLEKESFDQNRNKYGQELTFTGGIGLRDWFAGQAGPKLMVELLKNNTFSEALEKVGEHSYRYANAMLSERAKGER